MGNYIKNGYYSNICRKDLINISFILKNEYSKMLEWIIRVDLIPEDLIVY